MNTPLAPGDLAVVVESSMGLNIGKIVQLKHLDMPPHSLLGNIWVCSCKDEIVNEWGGKSNIGQFAEKWLKKIEPPKLTDQIKIEEELHG